MTHIFTRFFKLQTEVGWLLQNIPAVLSGVKNGTTGLTAVVRDEFRQRGHLTTDVSIHHLLRVCLVYNCFLNSCLSDAYDVYSLSLTCARLRHLAALIRG